MERLVSQTLQVCGTIAILGALLFLTFYAADALLLVFAAILLAVLLRTLANWTSRHTPLSDGWSLALTVGVCIIAVALTTWLLGMRISEQLLKFQEQLSSGVEVGTRYLEQYPWGPRLLGILQNQPSQLIPEGAPSAVPGALSSTLGVLMSALLVSVLGVFFAIDPSRYVEGFVLLVPTTARNHTRHLLARLHSVLAWWLVGRLASMSEVGVLTALGLWLVGVPLPVTLGAVTGLLNFVPNIGPLVAGGLTLVIAITASPMTAVYALCVQCAVGMFDGFVVTPLIQQRTISLPAGLILGSQLLAGVLLGGLGVALATPLTAVAVVLIRQLYVQDVLGDHLSV